MEESTYDLITELCFELAGDVTSKNPSSKKSVVKKLRSQAYEIILNNRNTPPEDDSQHSSALLLGSIFEQVYCKAKSKGQWTKDLIEDIDCLIEKAERLANSNPSFTSVLKFLLCLADNSPSSEIVYSEGLGIGSNMKITITDGSFEHKPLIKTVPTFDFDIFEVPEERSIDVGLQILSEKPGIGLKHKQFFIPSTFSTSVDSNKFEEDVNNGNWFHSKLNRMAIPVRNTIFDPRSSIHLDEGYVTPDQDLAENQHRRSYIPWEDLDNDSNIIFSWESYGSPVFAKEPQFIFQRRESVGRISKVIHASDSHKAKTELMALNTVGVEDLEVAFKNLLVGVESTIFHYDKGKNSFALVKGLRLKGSTPNTLEEYCKDFIECGNHFRHLSKIIKLSRHCGMVFLTLCNNIRQYLQSYRGIVLKMPAMLSLLDTRHWLFRLSTQIQFLISLCPINSERRSKDLLIYLCEKMPVFYRHDLSYIYYYILQSCFSVYFMFLSKWIFEGITNNMWEEEFFIKCNPLTEDMYNRKFWSEGFELDQELVPKCLKGIESELLLCGKSMALLNLCASEDPICKRVKREHPEIVYCFNKVDIDRVEERFKLYKESCKAECQELNSNKKPDVHNEDYYAGLLAKTINEIKERQEEERRLKTEKKQLQYNMLKKEMEDAKDRKIKENIILLEKEQKLIEEAEKIDQLNDLRRQEEREKIMQLYSSLSEAADRRRDKAEWKMKRAELYDKRCAFLNKEREMLEENIICDKEMLNDKSKLLYSERSLEKYLETYSPIPGSGDCVPRYDGKESLHKDSSSLEPHIEGEPSKQMLLGEEGDANSDLISDEPNNYHENPSLTNDRRDWLIALDVADQARQSALKFKKRNMHNDYNIITGEETTYENKFGEKNIQETNVKSLSCDITSPNVRENFLNDSKQNDDMAPDTEINPSFSGNNSIELNEEQRKGIRCGPDDVVTSNKPLMGTVTPFKHELSVNDSGMNAVLPILKLNSPLSLSQSDSDTHIQDIDMTSIYQNVQKSVMIPLLTQLELASGAILRLFSKHNLLQHMECIWKYFFLLEGEFARSLTANLFQEAQKVQHPSYLLNVMKLNSVLRCAVGTNLDEEYSERLSFYVKDIPTVFRTIDPGMMDCLSLRYKTHWPINIIITDELIAKQDLIFKHLLKLHRMSWALEETIYLLKDKKLFNSQEYRKVQLFRHVLTHFITAIKQYITAVVVEKTWYEFKGKFENATTVDAIFEMYRYYIRSVNSKCLLGKARVHTEQLLDKLFKEVLIFYEALRSGEWIHDAAGCFRHSNFPRINHAFDNFKKIADHLVYLFRKMSNSFPNIDQLVTTLSLNDFYTVKERDPSL